MRQSGILLHLTSLPGPEGIGTMGQEAREFVDFLQASGMAIWQVLPISPTGYGESPYQSFCSFAGNPLLIDLHTLEQEGLLAPQAPPDFGSPDQVDYPKVIAWKTHRLRDAFQQSADQLHPALDDFLQQHGSWLNDYALFMAAKQHFGGGSWMEWPNEPLRMRYPEAMAHYSQLFKAEIEYQVFVQYLFFRQWHQLKQYANERGIHLFGDMPIYVALDSSDCWASPQYFQLDNSRRPLYIAGVPPDYFTQDGQLWGNPVYDWKALKKDGYRWWIARLGAMASFFDLLRIDHFIGFANYYAVRAGARNARYGNWRIGPGRGFFDVVKRELPHLRIIAEDLGVVKPRVSKLLRYCGYPGMKVLTFAFGGEKENQHLPSNIPTRCAYYTGTHDNDTVLGWWSKADKKEKALVTRLLGVKKESDLCDIMARTVYGSVAQYAIVPMQDILELGESARMNTPGTLGGNWLWRMQDGQLTKALYSRLAAMNKEYERTST